MMNTDVVPDVTRSLALRVRAHIVRMTSTGKASHVASGLSVADVLAVLYGAVLRVRPDAPAWHSRDRLVMSKGHAAAALYAVLAETGFFSVNELASFCQPGSRLWGHVTSCVPGVELSTGSLGHGLGVAAGMALAGERESAPFRVFAVLSDGECDEGSVWEAAMFAGHHRLRNLVAVIDYNKLQSLTSVEKTLGLEPLGRKWEAFGWTATEVDGHDHLSLFHAFRSAGADGRPTCVVAHTTKGKGVSFMEDSVLWHYKSPTPEEVDRALAELRTLSA